MSAMEIPAIYTEVLRDCRACGKCMGRCDSLAVAGMSLLDVAGGMRNALSAADDEVALAAGILGTDGLVQAVRGCFFCENCIGACEAQVDVCSLVYKSREIFQGCGLIPREAWASVQVDGEWDVFTAYRAVYGIGYPDLTRHLDSEGHAAEHDCAAAFFPGCSLAAYNPELTRAVFAEVEGRCGKTTMLDLCCGSPLKSAGFLERAAALEQRIVDELAASGASVVACACPGCRNMLDAALVSRGRDEIRVITVSELFAGRVPVDLPGHVRFFKSCQDRDGAYLAATRALFAPEHDEGAICQGCCGAGGAVSAFAPEQQAAKVEDILGRCEAGDTLVTMCPTCTYTQAFELLQTGRDDVRVKNYLELLFGHDFDWPAVFARLSGMWSGEYAAWLAQVLS